MTENRKQLIYNCASEAVLQARIKIANLLKGRGPLPAGLKDEIDEILYRCQCKAGNWAVEAATAKLVKGQTTIKLSE